MDGIMKAFGVRVEVICFGFRPPTIVRQQTRCPASPEKNVVARKYEQVRGAMELEVMQTNIHGKQLVQYIVPREGTLAAQSQ